MAWDERGIRTADYTLQHSPDVLGVFEPVSGVMFLNVENERLQRWRGALGSPDADERITEVFFHEAYHCFQTLSTGYLHSQYLRLFEAFRKQWRSWRPGLLLVIGPLRVARALDRVFDSAGSVVLSKRARIMLSEARRHRANRRYIERLARRSDRYRQSSIMGAILPGLYREVEDIQGDSLVRGSDGLSAQDIVEGAAFSYGREAVLGAIDLDGLRDPALDANGPYQRLVTLTADQDVKHPPRRMRAASALALRYERPANAYMPLLQRLAGGGEASEVERARSLSRRLPELPDAGRLLGTAADVRLAANVSYPLYRDHLQAIATRAWGIDEIDLLIDHKTIKALPRGRLGFSIMTSDGALVMETAMRGVAPLIGSTMLPNGPSIAKLRRDLRLDVPL